MARKEAAMAQSSEEQSQDSGNTSKGPKYQVPAGYTSQSADIVGFWNGDKCGSLHWIPRSAKLTDSKLDEDKTSILIVGEAFEPCKLLKKDEDGESGDYTEVQVNKGDLVGVWYKPGMLALKTLADVPVLMWREGEKKIKNKPSPMKLYEIFSGKKGNALKVTEDHRETSKGTKNFLSVGSSIGDEDDSFDTDAMDQGL